MYKYLVINLNYFSQTLAIFFQYGIFVSSEADKLKQAINASYDVLKLCCATGVTFKN